VHPKAALLALHGYQLYRTNTSVKADNPNCLWSILIIKSGRLHGMHLGYRPVGKIGALVRKRHGSSTKVLKQKDLWGCTWARKDSNHIAAFWHEIDWTAPPDGVWNLCDVDSVVTALEQ
jgi:hypothetical protein